MSGRRLSGQFTYSFEQKRNVHPSCGTFSYGEYFFRISQLNLLYCVPWLLSLAWTTLQLLITCVYSGRKNSQGVIKRLTDDITGFEGLGNFLNSSKKVTCCGTRQFYPTSLCPMGNTLLRLFHAWGAKVILYPVAVSTKRSNFIYQDKRTGSNYTSSLRLYTFNKAPSVFGDWV